ncbi:MAG: Tyrosyl-tRNA synthetase [Parcubacteria group bacterium GW2011_GWA1_42_7]|nr:MAG: Tyrosyl-tRNA synthetase [Parcubacteria group bacterium GW2011_GWB1_42_6]KKS70098.1 MAG: Tyrosyl-tRNA synthetase [Parcubacteria group bacterium GW2011_GWA1_42_7]KKS92490.1 MAG: Tyrosyl-tRNA synthetase [Parcubacteria group bacterium GW2011_GWC1_43_12]
MDINQKLNLITRNTEEILTEEELKELLETKEIPVVYHGTAPTGRPHIGYLIPAIKIKDFIDAGLKVKFLLANIHAFLDNMKSPIELANKRAEFYKQELSALYEAIGIDISKIEFVLGSDYQLSKEYSFDVYRLAAMTTADRAKHAAAEVVKMGENPRLSGFLYPLLQILDEQYLGADIQYAGADQRKIFGFARESHPKLGYKKRIEIMTPMLPGIMGGKMSASDVSSKIDLLDSPETISDKINKAYCPEGVLEDNGIMIFMKYVIMVLKSDRGDKFMVERSEKFGGNIEYSNYEELEKDFVAKSLHPADLKKALAAELSNLLEPVRKAFQNKENMVKEAYPEG